MHTNAVFGPDGVDLSRIEAGFVRFGVVVRVPFRFRVTDLAHISSADAASDIWIHNRVAIPSGSHLPGILSSLPGRDSEGYAALWSDAVVVLNEPVLVDGAREALKRGDAGALALGGNLFRALTALNEMIFGYSEAVGTIWGGASLHFLSDTEFFSGLRLEFAFVSNSPNAVTTGDVREIVEWRPPIVFRSAGGQLTGDLEDLASDSLNGIPKKVAEFRAHAYHELAFRAKMAMLDREPMVALVLACAALEGAHAAFLREYLSSPLSAMTKGKDGLINDLLREQGISTLIRLTSMAFLPLEHRPSPDAVERCLGALVMRNDIMHAKQSKGTYRIRIHTFAAISEAYQSVFAIYSAYVAALRSVGEGSARPLMSNER